MTVNGYGTLAADQDLQPVKFNRKPLGAGEVAIDIAFCGVCHSDVHQCADDWENTVWICAEAGPLEILAKHFQLLWNLQ